MQAETKLINQDYKLIEPNSHWASLRKEQKIQFTDVENHSRIVSSSLQEDSGEGKVNI